MLGLGNSLTSGVVLDEFGTNHSILFDGTNDEIDFTTSGFQTALTGSGGLVVDNDTVFPKGLTIYGRWTRVSLQANSTHGIICYYGE